MLILQFIPLAVSQDKKPQEYQVKAVYLYNFAKFISWPSRASNSEVFPICIFGQDPFGQVLDSIVAGEKINGQGLVVRRLTSTSQIAPCRIVFISQTESGRVKEIVNVSEKNAVATVSDIEGFATRGGMIQFVLEDNRVRFEVNLDAVKNAGLVFSSQLLKVATTIQEGEDRSNP